MRMFRLYRRTSPVKALRPGDSPVVFVANHPTLCDVTSIVSMCPNIVAIARPTFARNPLINRALRLCGFVPTGIHMLKECEQRLRMGFDVLVFPEGTRSPLHGPLRTFHRGAFELAARARYRSCCSSSRAIRPRCRRVPIWKFADTTAVLTIEPFGTIDPNTTGLDSRVLSRQIEQRYREVLGYSDALREAT